MKWVDISQQNPGRSATACRLRYQNYTEKKEWAEDEKDMLARLYHRFMEDMWKRIADEMCRPWRSCERMHWQLGEEEMLRRANVQYRGGGPTPPGGHLDDLENDAASPPSTAGLTDDDQTASPSYQHSHTAQSPHQRAHHYHHHGPHPQHPQHSPYALSHSHHALSREPSREPSREQQQQQWPPPPLPSSMMPSSLPTRPTSATSTIASVGQPMSPQMPLPPGMQPQQHHPLRHHNPAAAAPPALTLHQPLPTGGYHHTPLLGTPRQTPTPLSSSASAGAGSAGGMRPVTPLTLAVAAGGGGSSSSDHLAQQQQGHQQQQQQQPNPSGTTPRTVPTVVHGGGHAGPGRLASPFHAGGGSSSSERPTTAGSMTDREGGDVVGGGGKGGSSRHRHHHNHHHHHHHHYPHQSAGFVADMDAVQVKKEARVGDD
ncbi:hypothetical protein BK809_0000120 [Diplodia seriata]|uniref:HTH myb-type domain-containing protein n=1 Tax=Diplodia seriata TaxID=420778 RepID=A0A1S8BGZ0_9PEZI|nr:hypothetical protein BK809_0000120 [Diplodia seriata]